MDSWIHSERKYKTFLNNLEVDKIPDVISQWIARLHLLYDVPFSYLVPDEKMLPMESMRFFNIDKYWVKTLSFGALSVGRNTDIESDIDSLSKELFDEGALKQLKYPRHSKIHEKHLKMRKLERTYSVDDPMVSGFLLRSVIVSSWKGIELEGFSIEAGKENPLQILRIEAISDNILLCLFSGRLDKVVISEPSEILRFAIPKINNQRQLTVKSLEVGQKLENNPKITVDTNQYGKIDFIKLANTLETTLKLPKDKLNSAHIAYELISSANKCEVSRK